MKNKRKIIIFSNAIIVFGSLLIYKINQFTKIILKMQNRLK